jgi:NTP pyrophosphatase (non-canonical NTP hydrolase)
MSHARDSEIYEEAVRQWGIDHNLWQLVEEMAELVVAISHGKRGRGKLVEVAEEVADVKILLALVEQIWNIGPEVETYRVAKMARLEKQLWPE